MGPAAKARVRETGTEPTQVVTQPKTQASAEEITTMATFPNPSAFRVTSTRGVLFDRHSIVVSGEYIPAEGSGTRFMWYPYKAALRAGTVSADQWDDVNVGRQSIAMGSDTKASGLASTAMGSGTVAIGDYSVAMGYYPAAVGKYSTAMGSETMATGEASTAMGASTIASGSIATAMGRLSEAVGSNSTAMGNSTIASGDDSTAMGEGTSGSGGASTAMGSGTTASGNTSTALGSWTVASGAYSTTMGTTTYASGTASIAAGNGAVASGSLSVAIGRGAVASGDYSTALGVQTRAESYNETVIGAWNIPSGGDPDDWIPTEPLFVIGNGTDLDEDSNAMVVLKNGNTGIGTSIPAVPLHVDRGADCTPNSGGYLVINGTNSTNICFDNNEIMARNNGAVASLTLNNEGGSTIIGGPLVVRQLTSPNVDYGICADLDGRIAYCGSSNRYKEKIEPLRLGIRTVEKMEPVTFKWKDRDELSLGFIAEQVAAIDPLLATYDKDGEVQGVKYPQLTAVLVNAMQEQQAEIAAQRGEIVALHRELQRYRNLAAEVAEIKHQLATSQLLTARSPN